MQPTYTACIPSNCAGRVGKQTSPKAIEQLAQGDTENRAKLRSSPHGCELVSSGEWWIDDSGTLHLTTAALVGIFVCKTSVYGVSALGAQGKARQTLSLPSLCS